MQVSQSMKRMEVDSPDPNSKKVSMIQNFNTSVLDKSTPKAWDLRKPKVISYMPSPNQKIMKASVLNRPKPSSTQKLKERKGTVPHVGQQQSLTSLSTSKHSGSKWIRPEPYRPNKTAFGKYKREKAWSFLTSYSTVKPKYNAYSPSSMKPRGFETPKGSTPDAVSYWIKPWRTNK